MAWDAHICCLVHSLGSTNEQSGAPWETSLQSHEDHEIPTDQPGLRQKSQSYLFAVPQGFSDVGCSTVQCKVYLALGAFACSRATEI